MLILVGWSLIALLFTAHNYLSYHADGRPVPLGHAVYWSISEWYTWALLTPLVFWLARRFPLVRGRWPASMPLLLAAGLGVSVLQIAIQWLLDVAAVAVLGTPAASVWTWLGAEPAISASAFGYLVQRKIGFDYFVYWMIVLVAHLLAYYRLYRDRDGQASRLEAELVRARLQVLSSQLQPHFLFNALNAVAELVYADPRRAERMLLHLSTLLRRALDESPDVVPLSRELELLEAYLAIERARFGRRLRARMDVPWALRGALVPPLLLQPLVENAVRHAIQPRPGGGIVRVGARRVEEWLELSVTDDGPGMPRDGAAARGVGLGNTRARLEAVYGRDHEFVLENRAGGGLAVRVLVPWREGRRRAPAAPARAPT